MQQGNGTQSQSPQTFSEWAVDALFCEASSDGVACKHCRKSLSTVVSWGPQGSPTRLCDVRMAQHAATIEIAAQRSAKALEEREAREKAARDSAERTLSDEMRGGLHAYGGTAQTTHNGTTGERYFTRSEVLAVLRSYKALHAQTTQPTLVGCIELIAMFERME